MDVPQTIAAIVAARASLDVDDVVPPSGHIENVTLCVCLEYPLAETGDVNVPRQLLGCSLPSGADDGFCGCFEGHLKGDLEKC